MDEFITYYAVVNEFSGGEKPFAVVRRVKEETRRCRLSWLSPGMPDPRITIEGARLMFRDLEQPRVGHRGTAGGGPDSLTAVVNVIQTSAPRRETGGALM